MTQKMRSLIGHTSVHHAGVQYKPDEDGVFAVDDAHIDALKSHGLMLEGDAASAERAAIKAQTLSTLKAENEMLKQQLFESTLVEENERLRREIADFEAWKARQAGESSEAEPGQDGEQSGDGKDVKPSKDAKPGKDAKVKEGDGANAP